MFDLEINEDICILKECDVNEKAVFNSFWNKNTNIIYITDNTKKFVGIVTNRQFFNQLEKGSNMIPISKNCSSIMGNGKSEEEILDCAMELFERYNISTGIPVLDEAGRIVYEVRTRRVESDVSDIQDFKDKLQRYERSCYLRNELILLREILCKQDIVIWGTEKEFDDTLGELFEIRERITFDDAPDDKYDYLYNNSTLLIDMSAKSKLGRNEIYNYISNGYGIRGFINIITYIIENEICSKFYNIIGNDIITIGDTLEDTKVKTIRFSSVEIFTIELKKYLRSIGIELVENTGIIRGIWFTWELNGNQYKSKFQQYELISMEVVFQYYMINRLLDKTVPVLNFSFDAKLELTDYERIMLKKRCISNDVDYEKNIDKERFYSVNKRDIDDINEIIKDVRSNVKRNFENDLLILEDVKSDRYNVENGMRKTENQPTDYCGTVYFIGLCTMYGSAVEDNNTIPSIIQRYVNESGKKYRMVNLGNGRLINCTNLINALDIQDNDIFVVLFQYTTSKLRRLIRINEIGDKFNEIRLKKYHGADCFYDGHIAHCADNGNVIYSEIIYDELKKYLKDDSTGSLKRNNIWNIFKKNYSDLDALYGYGSYREELQCVKALCGVDLDRGRIGSIVMNCNPFTLGHRYLIERALETVDFLYIFVVEEDKSYFSYRDRFEMVQRGVSDLRNVAVVRSGKLIISQVTFKAYFEKESINTTGYIGNGADSRVFAQYIAPELGIGYRFVGEEPYDIVTAEYNRVMKEILPQFDIEVIEIPRKKCNEDVISASRVRTYYKRDDFESLSTLVPQTTLEYLKELKRN